MPEDHSLTSTEYRYSGWAALAEPGDCSYCDNLMGQETPMVKAEPFGGKPACFLCWELICFGDET